MTALGERILELYVRPEPGDEADAILGRARALDLVTDWVGTEKERDFARLVVAARRMLGPGGSVETGVFHGGTSAVLLLTCAAESFHVGIDPYGLPGQAYGAGEYADWPAVRRTALALHRLAVEQGATYCPYLTDSLSFTRCDLLVHPGPFTVVHLDGDHSYATVHAELSYFLDRIAGPALYVMDDHDEHFPGVDAALRRFSGRLERLLHQHYDVPGYGRAGFSAWLG